MKKPIIFIVGLLTLGVTQVYSMEQTPLTKEQQKEFRQIRAGYHQGYLHQQVLQAMGKNVNTQETKLLNNYKELLDDYKRLHGNDPLVVSGFQKIEAFKVKVAKIVNLVKEVKAEEV